MSRLIVFQVIALTFWSVPETSGLSSDVITLGNGQKMPLVGFGTAEVDNYKDILEAIRIGYRKIDTGFVYDNEEAVGMALRKAMKYDDLKREDVFITTKIWNTFHSKELVERQMKLSLMNLDLDYVDLLLMQSPMGFEYPGKRNEKTWYPRFANGTTKPSSWNMDDYIETWRGMEEMVKKNWTKSIGLANFNVRQVNKILRYGDIKPVMNQIELNVFYKQDKLVKHCQKQGVQVEAYAPLHSAVSYEPIIKEIAKKYKKEPTQVALRWLLERGFSLNVKSTQKDRMKENLDIFNFNLTRDEVNDILKLKDKEKRVDDKGSRDHPDYPFHVCPEDEDMTTTTKATTTEQTTSSTTTSSVESTTITTTTTQSTHSSTESTHSTTESANSTQQTTGSATTETATAPSASSAHDHPSVHGGGHSHGPGMGSSSDKGGHSHGKGGHGGHSHGQAMKEEVPVDSTSTTTTETPPRTLGGHSHGGHSHGGHKHGMKAEAAVDLAQKTTTESGPTTTVCPNCRLF